MIVFSSSRGNPPVLAMRPEPTFCGTLSWIVYVCVFGILFGASLTEGADDYVGCFKDEGDPRAFRGYAENFNDLTPQKCNEFCYSKGFLYSATQGRTFCFCNDKHPNPNSKVSEDRCSRPCSGNPVEKCGSDGSISVRKTGITDYPEVSKYIGCFDDHSRLLNDIAVVLDSTNSPRRCMNYCLKLGHRYAGVQYGRGCHCGSAEPERQYAREGRECNWPCTGDAQESCGGNWRMAIYSTNATDLGSQTSTDVGKHLGCYEELSNPGRTSYIENLNDLTPKKCTELCYNKGFLYSWTQSSTFCFCGDKHPNPNSRVGEDRCSKPCAGSSAEKCGGDTAISVMETGIPDFSDIGKYIGCFDDHTRLLNDVGLDLEFSNSPKRCMNLCLKMGYQYSGVQYGKGCHCGNQKPDPKFAEPGDECNWPCSGDSYESCGGNWRMAIYSTNPSAPDALPLGVSGDKGSCVKSDTLVNGKTVCQGDVVFEETFTGDLSQKWKHVVMIPDAPDYEFNVLHAEKRNSYTRDGKLVIKPTMYDDVHVLSGTLKLQGCTAPRDSRQCGFTAFSNRILPPVASARINTRDFFSFRYGKVEIRAKLPKGDWLVPELWLEPKDHFYGPEYSSGRVRIAMSRGNGNLRCDGEDFGYRQLESGVLMGPKNNVRKRTIRIKLPENWHDHYHNYTIIWKPGSISFKIDNEKAREIVPAGKRLCEAHDFEYEECLTWSSGTMLAPLDKDFFLTLGLSTGNAWDFPDDCVNGGKPKPWKNHELKALLKFWQDRENWQSTWSEEGSSMHVDHVRVTAV